MPIEAKEEFHLPFDQKGINLLSWKELEPFPGSNDIEITVGISNWNRDGTIVECIDSVCNQNFPKKNYEIIIVDDCSEDNSRVLIRHTIEKYQDNLIRYYELEESRTKNEHHPHNVTIRKALGKIFVKVSGDTLLSRNYLEGVWRHHNVYNNLFLHCFWGGISKDMMSDDCSNFMVMRKEALEKIIKLSGLEEDKLRPCLNPDLPVAHENKHPVDTGGSMYTKWWQKLHGFDEQIQGNIPGDVCLICRCTRIGPFRRNA